MPKVLFICHGNICRSTMAEFVFRDMVRRSGREDEFYIEFGGDKPGGDRQRYAPGYEGKAAGKRDSV